MQHRSVPRENRTAHDLQRESESEVSEHCDDLTLEISLLIQNIFYQRQQVLPYPKAFI